MKAKLHPLVMFLTVSFLLPLGEAVILRRVEPFGKFGLIQAVLTAVTIYWWYYLDKTQRGFRAGVFQNIGVAVLYIVALPIYFVRSRGWKRGAIATALGFVVFIASAALSYIGEIAGLRIAF